MMKSEDEIQDEKGFSGDDKIGSVVPYAPRYDWHVQANSATRL